MDKTILFILNSLEQQRCHKRIREFIAHGYAVRVYAFNRKTRAGNLPNFGYPIEVIGEFTNSVSYLARIGIIRSGIQHVVRANKGMDGIYYLFNLDIASIAYWLIDKPYIYEESDLMHTYISQAVLRSGFYLLDKRIIQKSLFTVLTSEGFVRYHFKDKPQPEKVCVIPNRLNPDIIRYPILPKKKLNIEHIKFGFVGDIRGRALTNFTRILTNKFPQHEMHFFGGCDDCNRPFFEPFKERENVFFHGPFLNPRDLPQVYSQIDVVLSTYDAMYENVRYAEPNKIYEAIYFETPIIVSSGTFLAEKINQLGIGFDVDAMDDEAVCQLIKSLTAVKIQEKVRHAAAIDKKSTINENSEFFAKLKSFLA